MLLLLLKMHARHDKNELNFTVKENAEKIFQRKGKASKRLRINQTEAFQQKRNRFREIFSSFNFFQFFNLSCSR